MPEPDRDCHGHGLLAESESEAEHTLSQPQSMGRPAAAPPGPPRLRRAAGDTVNVSRVGYGAAPALAA